MSICRPAHKLSSKHKVKVGDEYEHTNKKKVELNSSNDLKHFYSSRFQKSGEKKDISKIVWEVFYTLIIESLLLKLGELACLVSEYGKLAQKEYKLRHDNVGRYIHWQFCEKLGFNRARLWYDNEPESLVENKNFKIL